MKTLKFFAAALAIVAAASCVEVEDNPTGENNRDEAPVELVPVSFTATIDSPVDPSQSKTTLADDGVSVHWSEGDQINIFPYTGILKDHTSPYNGESIGIDSGTISEDFVKISAKLPSSSSGMYSAIYPDVAVYKLDCWGHKYTFTAPTLWSQTAVANNFSIATWGRTNTSSSTSNIAMAFNTPDGGTFKFKNVLAHLKFKVMVSGIRSIEFSASSTIGANGLSESSNIGGQLIYVPTSEDEGSFYLNSDESITITNSGADFEVGTTYYVAIPALSMTGFMAVGKNSAGDSMFQFQRTSQFDPQPNTIYNLGSFTATVADALTVSAQTLIIPPAGGSVSFTLTTNKDWTLVPSKDWTTVTPTSGGPGTYTITVTAGANNTGAAREPSYMDITAGTKVAYVSINQAKLSAVYSRGELVSNADAMVNGGYYVILRQGSTNDYLSFGENGYLAVAGISNVNDIPVKNIFVYHKDDTKEVTANTEYQHCSAGVFQSLYNNGYMDSSLQFVASSVEEAQYVTLGSQWGESDSNIDIYIPIYTPNTGALDYYDFIAYVNSSIVWKKASEVGSNNLRKWYFYKVNSTISE